MVTQSTRVQLRDQSGQILILTAVSMAVLLGIAALTLDASFMFAKRNRLHAAADAAAKSAAIEVIRNPTVSQASLEAFADQQVGAHGFVPTRLGGTTTVTINHGPSSGPFAGNARYVEAVVSEPTSTFFGRILGWVSMTPGATSVAGAGNPYACLMTTQDISIGNTVLTLNGCNVGVGGNLNGAHRNAVMTGSPIPSVGVVGTCTGTCTSMGTLTIGAPATSDPLVGLAAPANPGSCSAGATPTLNPGCYTSIGPTVTTLTAGIYYVTGPVQIDNLSGTNVMIYLTGAGQLLANNNKQLTLTAPTSGPYTGIAIFQDPSNGNNFVANNNFTLSVIGAIYMPGANVDFENSLSFTSTTCTLFIARSLSVRNGNGTFSNSGCAGAFGSALYLTATIAQ